MKKFLTLAVAFTLAACGANLNVDRYETSGAGTVNTVSEGVIVNVRPVTIATENGEVGQLAGGIVGGVAGSMVGDSTLVQTIGAVGGAMLQSPLLGLVIYISNVVAVILCSLIINILERKVKSKKKEMINATLSQNTLNSLSLSPSTLQQQKSASLSNIALDTVMGLLVVGFFVAIFSLFIDLLTDIKVISSFAHPLKIIFKKLKK